MYQHELVFNEIEVKTDLTVNNLQSRHRIDT